METKSATYEPTSRIETLRERALAQPDAMFLPMHRPYFYVEGWMDAKGESLPIRNAKALANVIRKMPVLLFDEEIIVGESGDNQCDGMVNFGLTMLDVWQRRIDGSPLTEEQKDQYMAWMSEKPFEFMNLAPVSPMPD